MDREQKKVRVSTLVWLLIVVCLLTVALCKLFYDSQYSEKILNNSESSEFAEKINEVNSIIEKYYINPEGETDLDFEKLQDYALYGYIIGLGDKYSAYTSAEDMKKQLEDRAGNFTGIGVMATQSDDDLIEILEVYNNSPAMEAGIEAGDIITYVGSTPISEVGYSEGVDLILGEAGTSVDLVVERDGNELSFTIERRTIKLDSVTYDMLSNNTGYIRIRDFNDVTYEGFLEAMDTLSLRAEGGKLSGIVFDLRNNTGGTLESIVSVLDDILPEGNIVKLVDKNGREEVYTSDSSEIDIPMCVIVNGSTASASELFAGSLRDYGKAQIVGTKTYGKGCALGVFMLSDGSSISIVDEMYYTASGANFEGVGIEPDVRVEMPDELRKYMFYLGEDEDPQLKAAVDILNGKQ